MKQCITKAQWEELNTLHNVAFTKAICPNAIVSMFGEYVEEEYPSIGQMIEFMGDEFSIDKLHYDCGIKWEVYTTQPFIKDELCDALWEAVKCKLNI